MRIPIKAWYFESTVDDRRLREKFRDYVIEGNDPLTLRVDDVHRVLVTSFGAVVFWPFDEAVARQVSARIRETLSNPKVVEELEDRLVVESEKGEEKILFNEVWLKGAASPEQMRIIAMLLAQSVALEYLENEVDAALENFSGNLDSLREHGRIVMPPRQVLKTIGFAMHTRHEVLSHLALIDKPAETWESESLAGLHAGLHDLFDLPARQKALSTKLGRLAEDTAMFFQVLDARKAHRLEWIIIALIVFEVILTLAKDVFHWI
jgi:required for meiotic nuclear division protein 1